MMGNGESGSPVLAYREGPGRGPRHPVRCTGFEPESRAEDRLKAGHRTAPGRPLRGGSILARSRANLRVVGYLLLLLGSGAAGAADVGELETELKRLVDQLPELEADFGAARRRASELEDELARSQFENRDRASLTAELARLEEAVRRRVGLKA